MEQNGRKISRRAVEWILFYHQVIKHIEEYTVPQYGDKPDDQVESWTAADCMQAIRKYAARYGSNARGEAEQKRDLLKIAHYAGIAYSKMQKGDV